MKKIYLLLACLGIFVGCSSSDWKDHEGHSHNYYNQDQELDRAINESLEGFDPETIKVLEK